MSAPPSKKRQHAAVEPEKKLSEVISKLLDVMSPGDKEALGKAFKADDILSWDDAKMLVDDDFERMGISIGTKNRFKQKLGELDVLMKKIPVQTNPAPEGVTPTPAPKPAKPLPPFHAQPPQHFAGPFVGNSR